MAGAGLGDLVSAFQGGYDFSRDAHRKRQTDKMYDYMLEQGQYESESRRKGRQAGRDQGAEYESDFSDWSKMPPLMALGQKMAGWMTSRRTGVSDPDEARMEASGYTDPAATTQAASELAGLDEDKLTGPPMADGGAVRDSRGRAIYPLDPNAPEQETRRSRGILWPETRQQAIDPRLAEPAPQHSGPPGGLTPSAMPIERPAPPRTAVPAPAAPVSGAPKGPNNRGPVRSAPGRQPKGAAPATAIPEKAAAPYPQYPGKKQTPFIDPSEVDLPVSELPNVGVQDWVKYRKDMMEAAGATGDPERVRKAMDAVTSMQVEGFKFYGSAALQALQSGDEEGAAKAMQMAYQYFPNGSTVRFAKYGEQLVAVGLDEKTGQPKGAMPLDAERLAGMLDNFKDPGNFRVWTKDEREIMDAEYNRDVAQWKAENIELPNAESQRRYQDRAGVAAVTNAAGNYVKDTAGADGTTGPKPLTMAQALAEINEQVTSYIADPAVAQQIVPIAAHIYKNNPRYDGNPALVVKIVEEAIKSGTLPQVLAEIGYGQ